jgi:hypothetical protein
MAFYTKVNISTMPATKAPKVIKVPLNTSLSLNQENGWNMPADIAATLILIKEVAKQKYAAKKKSYKKTLFPTN